MESVQKSSGNIFAGVGIILIAMLMRNLTRPDTQEISFQHFKTQLLAKDVVDRIEVANKTTAKVLPHCSRVVLFIPAPASCITVVSQVSTGPMRTSILIAHHP